jgi:hypothetical protein
LRPGERRDDVLRRLSALDPAADEPTDAQFWNDALSAPPLGEEREQQLAAFLADLGCTRRAAHYVARGLIRNGRLRFTGLQVVATVADRLRKGKSDPSSCPGVTGLSDGDWAILDRLVADASRPTDEKTK